MVFTESIVARSVTSGLRRIVVTARVVANENQRILSTRAVDICKQSLLGDAPHERAGLRKVPHEGSGLGENPREGAGLQEVLHEGSGLGEVSHKGAGR